MMQRRVTPRGATLVELMAVLAVLGIAALAVSLRIVPMARSGTAQWQAIEQVRRSALAARRDTTFVLEDGGLVVVVTVYADGTVKRSSMKRDEPVH